MPSATSNSSYPNVASGLKPPKQRNSSTQSSSTPGKLYDHLPTQETDSPKNPHQTNLHPTQTRNPRNHRLRPKLLRQVLPRNLLPTRSESFHSPTPTGEVFRTTCPIPLLQCRTWKSHHLHIRPDLPSAYPPFHHIQGNRHP